MRLPNTATLHWLCRRACLLCCALTLTLLGACARNDNAGLTAASTQALRAATPPPGAPRLPAPASLLAQGRLASASYGVVRAEQYSATLPHYAVALTSGGSPTASLKFTPADLAPAGLGGCSYAVYEVPLDQSGILSFKATWHTAPEGGQTYIGLGNLALGRWDWSALADPAATLNFDNSPDYFSPQKVVLVAILLTPGSPAELDYFSLNAEAAGWHLVDLLSLDTDDGSVDFANLQSAVVNGKPAVFFDRYTNSTLSERDIAVSSTATGSDSADWSVTPVSGVTGLRPAFGTVGGGYAIVDRVTNGANFELHFHQAVSIGDLSQDELVYSSDSSPSGSGSTTPSAVGEVAGHPYILFAQGKAGITIQYPWYSWADVPDSGTWHTTQVSTRQSPFAEVSRLAPALDFGGKPLLAFASWGGDSGPLLTTIAQPGIALPTSDTDWSVLTLTTCGGSTPAFGLFNAKPCVVSATYGFDPTQFYLAQMTGTDPLSAGDWGSGGLPALNLGFTWFGGGIVLPDRLLLTTTTGGVANPQLGTADNFVTLSSDAPANDATAWSSGIISNNTQHGYEPVLLNLNGQPAFAVESSFNAGVDSTRYRRRIEWGVYVP